MKLKYLLLLIVLSTYTFSQTLSLDGLDFGISETKDGYIDLYQIDVNGKKTSVLDTGLYMNSRIFIKDSDRRFYLRDQGKYVVSVNTDSFIIKWRVETLDVTEKYTKTDIGFEYSINLKNRTDKDRNIGVYLMFDTYLGENDNNHYIIENYKIIKNEKTYNGSEIPLSIISKNSRDQFVEFRLMDNKAFIPDELILGNWDRLAYSKKWPYKPKDGSKFSYGYYSINDSAIGVLYNGININPGKDVSYAFNINLSQNSAIIIETSEKEEPQEKKKKWINLERVDSTKDETLVDEFVKPETEDIPEVDGVKNDENIIPLILDSETEDEINIDNTEPIIMSAEAEREELLQMLDYIQKKKKGEDVSEYDFDEEYILKKLKERNE